jgi:sulfur carrier protein
MELRVNGEIILIEGESVSLPSLLSMHGVSHETPGVAIAVNDEVVRRTAWNEIMLYAGDRVEIITARQGG